MFPRALTLALIALVIPAAAPAHEPPAPPLRVEILSNRADLISAGDALVAVSYAKGVDPADIRVWSAGRDVTSDFGLRANGRYEGLVTGLPPGMSHITAKLPDGRGARIAVSDHPNGGPVFSGPQVQPWKCEDGATDGQ